MLSKMKMAGFLPLLTVLIICFITLQLPLEVGMSLIISNHRVKRTTTSDEETIIKAHNLYRNEAGAADMEYMKWSDDLSSIASEWVSGCDQEANDPTGISHSFGSIGRNFVLSEVDAANAGSFNLEQAVLLWNLEKMNYNYTTAKCTDGRQCEHYQQIVYASTTHVGCDYKLCGLSPVTILFGCYYGPRADLTVQPYTEGESCSLCTSGSFFCQTGCCIDTCDISTDDCECKAECDNCGTPDASTCTCSCKEGYSGPTCSEGPGNGCDPPQETTTEVMTTTELTTTPTESVTTPPASSEELSSTEAAVITTSFSGECPDDYCLNGGTAEVNQKDTRCRCICPDDFEGYKCNKAVETTTGFSGECPSDYCLNGGTAEVNQKGTRCRCICLDDYEGYKCNKAVVTTTAFSGQCPSDYCLNGGTAKLNKKRTRCRCLCPKEYHGYKCNKKREEANKGVEVALTANISMFEIIWQIFVSIVVRYLNSFCCFNVQSCCGGAIITKAPLSYRFVSSSQVVLGSGFPEGGRTKMSFLYYVKAERQNSLCSYAYTRGKRQATEDIELPQELLQSVVEDAQAELNVELEDCCNASIESIGPGQIYIDQEEDEGSELPLIAIITGVIVAILFLVMILMVYLVTRKIRRPLAEPFQWKPPRGRSNLYPYINRPSGLPAKQVYFSK